MSLGVISYARSAIILNARRQHFTRHSALGHVQIAWPEWGSDQNEALTRMRLFVCCSALLAEWALTISKALTIRKALTIGKALTIEKVLTKPPLYGSHIGFMISLIWPHLPCSVSTAAKLSSILSDSIFHITYGSADAISWYFFCFLFL